MAVVSNHGKGWAVFLPPNALLADRDHGAVKIETGGKAGKGVIEASGVFVFKHKSYQLICLTGRS